MTGSSRPCSLPQAGGDSPDSLVLLNTGNGKGKSTAALGVVLRALALGWPVCVVQFLKSEGWSAGEEVICRRLGVTWLKRGDGFTWDSANMDASRDRALATWVRAKETLSSGEYRLVVLDEVTYPLAFGWIGAPVSTSDTWGGATKARQGTTMARWCDAIRHATIQDQPGRSWTKPPAWLARSEYYRLPYESGRRRKASYAPLVVVEPAVHQKRLAGHEVAVGRRQEERRSG